ncbi:MAG: [FeFe] hydrogenase H-cluster maturation GTPase HydF [Bacteroidales bacterium]|nr:[FeFe] hydrogenase H-cluster maturation GTPase HydF [Bacteroidales bacterium]
MSINSVHIGIFGRRNIGKSSLISMLTGQDSSIIENFTKTTTDPVKKMVEIFNIGPVVLVDTAGIDDLGEIGNKKIQKSQEVILKVDCAILLIAGNQFGDYEVQLIEQFKKNEVPYFFAHNKNDIDKIAAITVSAIKQHSNATIVDFDTVNSKDRDRLIAALKRIIPATAFQRNSLIGDLVHPRELVLLVTPVDSESPEGQMTLPQSQTIRDALNNQCITVVIRENEMADFLKLGFRPDLVITDSSAFGLAAELLPEDIPLTSFSILFARMKGNFSAFLEGTPHISRLKEGDKVLLLESGTHQDNYNDINSGEISKLLQQFTGKNLNFTLLSGLSELPPRIRDFSLVIQCGGCMVTRKQLLNRLRPFIERGIPVTNYGMILAYIHGVFRRATKMLERKPINLSLFPDN